MADLNTLGVVSIDTTVIDASIASALKSNGAAEKKAQSATKALINAFEKNGWTMAHTLSPFENDGQTVSEDSKSQATPEQYTAMLAAYAEGKGKLDLFLVCPNELSDTIAKAEEGFKNAQKLVANTIAAVESAKDANSKKRASEALERNEKARDAARAELAAWKEVQTERNTLRRDLGSLMSKLRRSLSNAMFDAEVNFHITVDAMDEKEAKTAAAQAVKDAQDAIGVSVDFKGRKFLDSDDSLADLTPQERAEKVGKWKDDFLKKLDNIGHCQAFIAHIEAFDFSKH